MAKGGPRARSGPSPDPNALRRERDNGAWTDLPIEGRNGPTPEWPLSTPTKRELEFWEREWRRPQAIMWERDGQETEVALYVRGLRVAESPKAPTNARIAILRMMEGLGISQPGLHRNRWRIVGEAVPGSTKSPRASGSARDRLKVVDGGA